MRSLQADSIADALESTDLRTLRSFLRQFLQSEPAVDFSAVDDAHNNFPAAVFLGKITGIPLAIDMGMLVLWTVFFFGLSRLAYHAGLKRYSGFGG